MKKMGAEIIRLVDLLHREREIDREIVFRGLEAALLTAARKHFGGDRNLSIIIDRDTGDISASDDEGEIQPAELGRIAAQTAKQVMMQKIREAERDAIVEEMNERLLTIISGTVHRFEGPNLVINMSKIEGFLPRSEQIPNESYRIGERIRALIIEAKPVGSRARIVLSRTKPELIQRLFEIEVPEIDDGVVEIKAIAREPGYRTKVAVSSNDSRVDSVGACVGIQGARIRNIVDELNGEKIDIVRWKESDEQFILESLKPSEALDIKLEPERRYARVIVPKDQLSLAIGKRGQNVRLVCKLTGWDLDIRPETEAKAQPEETAAQPETEEPAESTEPAEAVEMESPEGEAQDVNDVNDDGAPTDNEDTKIGDAGI